MHLLSAGLGIYMDYRILFFICFYYKGSVLFLNKRRRKQGVRWWSEQASELGNESAEDEEEGIWKLLERMYVCITESLCWASETNATL